MITSKAQKIELNCDAIDVSTDDFMLRVVLADGREIAMPLEYFPRLRDATHEQRQGWEIIGGGYGIHWEELDEDISVRRMLRIH
jgi:hypothetical protein